MADMTSIQIGPYSIGTDHSPLVIAEADRRSPLDLQIPVIDERRYGDTLIRIYGP